MGKSGAVLAWEQPKQNNSNAFSSYPRCDLWKFEVDGTREVQACLFSYPYDIELWTDLLTNKDVNEMRKDGEAIERKHFKDIDELIESAAYRTNIAGHDVPVLNAPYFFSSDAGHKMGKNEPFAACYWDTEKGRTYSLRSADDGVDVSEIATRFGGGGHKHAAGFSISYDDISKLNSPAG